MTDDLVRRRRRVQEGTPIQAQDPAPLPLNNGMIAVVCPDCGRLYDMRPSDMPQCPTCDVEPPR